MKTIILPGYSLHNKEWAEGVADKIGATVHYWLHWKGGGGFNLKKEIERILAEIGSEKVNLIAKSVGTMVTMHLLPKIPAQIEKIILCGIPTVSEARLGLFQTALAGFPPEEIIVFQNTKDPFASFAEVKKFMSAVNPDIKVVEKPRNDHNYPYFEDLSKFMQLSGGSK